MLIVDAQQFRPALYFLSAERLIDVHLPAHMHQVYLATALPIRIHQFIFHESTHSGLRTNLEVIAACVSLDPLDQHCDILQS
jgi:hypothetical protein